MDAARHLVRLEQLRDRFTPDAAEAKTAALRALARARLRSAGQVRRLHEILCFMRAYPDSDRVLRAVERLLESFAHRADLRAHRDALANDGIAGTVMTYPFFHPTAQWLAHHWPRALRLDRGDLLAGESIGKALPALLTAAERHGLQEARLAGYAALDALRGQRTDATFLLDRVAAMPADGLAREALYDLINPTCELRPEKGTPTRTTAVHRGGPRAWQTRPLRHERPDLRTEIARAPRAVGRVAPTSAQRLIDLARSAMVSRNRDLDAFAYGNPSDVWLCRDDRALAFVLIGTRPDRRVALPAIYGGLTLVNGVPVGYHQADFLGRMVAVSFNTFETFRGGESAYIFARLLATLRRFGGASAFSIEPYQLGQGNDEGIASGAWWFYFKLGFRPRALDAKNLARLELQRQRRNPAHRTSAATLRSLADHPMFFDLDPADAAPFVVPAAVGLAAGRFLARLEVDREDAVSRAVERVSRACSAAPPRKGQQALRRAWEAWAPTLAMLQLGRWSATDRGAVPPLLRAKAAPSERGYARLLAGQSTLLRALASLKRPGQAK